MKRVLVLYYSQTGQMKNALESITSPLQGSDVSLVWEELKPAIPFPFPWPTTEFFDVMPECVADKPIALQPFTLSADERFDLIILGWQPWFLAPSLPIISLFHHPTAQHWFKDTPVVTINACRNMWIGAQERVKKNIYAHGGRLVGNIVLEDRQPNLISVLTVIGWLIKGKREKHWGFLPKAGVSDNEIAEASRFGKSIHKALTENQFENLQPKLLAQGAVQVKANLMLLELRGAKIFKIWEKFISSKGGPGAKARRPRVILFSWLLPIGIFILSPISTVLATIVSTLVAKKIQPMIDYYQGVTYREKIV